MRKLIVVTGATKGIGRAIAERFAQEDFDVVICARKSDELEKLKADFGAKYPSSKVYVQAA
ncbi:MAG TPA: SDR family NAD(P)-dependent oxidoreductase, partial [Cyclobacteriaceae bacterium]|nr:SDR family NAD(P)-dependent oxidoreductase [Cyclobacteriaceae bacterium]